MELNALFVEDLVDVLLCAVSIFLLAVSPWALCPSSLFPLCVIVDHCVFW